MNKINRKILIKSQKGVTLIALVVTIIVLLIIAGISIYSGTDSLNKANLEELKTNMLLIKAKAREYVEEANFKIGKDIDNQDAINVIKEEVYEINGKLKKATDVGITNVDQSIPIEECYVVTNGEDGALKYWGLDKIITTENEKYLLKFDEKNITVEIYNTKGYDGKYSLTDLEK